MLWCNHHYRKINDTVFKDQADALIRQIAKSEDEAVRHIPAYQYYQTLYYEERVLPKLKERWAEAIAEAQASGLEKPVPLSVCQRVVQECWEAESEDFKKHVVELEGVDYQSRRRRRTFQLRKSRRNTNSTLPICCAHAVKLMLLQSLEYLWTVRQGFRRRVGAAHGARSICVDCWPYTR